MDLWMKFLVLISAAHLMHDPKIPSGGCYRQNTVCQDLAKITVELDQTELDQKTSELEALKSQQINQGMLGEVLIGKLVQTKGFAAYTSDLCQEAVKVE